MMFKGVLTVNDSGIFIVKFAIETGNVTMISYRLRLENFILGSYPFPLFNQIFHYLS
jgi:hypothetical protein